MKNRICSLAARWRWKKSHKYFCLESWQYFPLVSKVAVESEAEHSPRESQRVARGLHYSFWHISQGAICQPWTSFFCKVLLWSGRRACNLFHICFSKCSSIHIYKVQNMPKRSSANIQAEAIKSKGTWASSHHLLSHGDISQSRQWFLTKGTSLLPLVVLNTRLYKILEIFLKGVFLHWKGVTIPFFISIL